MSNIIGIEDMLKAYPTLSIQKNFSSKYIINGTITLNKIYNEVHFYKQYDIEISIDETLEEIPIIKEISNKISSNYPHRYQNGELCLGINTEIILKCTKDNQFNIMTWIEYFVLPYFYSYEYYTRFNEYPFGDRPHGSLGILEFYSEFLSIKNIIEVFKILDFVANNKYKGHLKCPCNSGKIIRKCHKESLMLAQQPLIRAQIIKDLVIIKEELNEQNK